MAPEFRGPMNEGERCPDCGEPLKMLRRWLFSPSEAWCGACAQIVNVEFDHESGKWRIHSVERNLF